MLVPESDVGYLSDRHLVHEISEDQGMTCIVFPGWRLPPGYDCETADLLIRLSAGYPDVPLDMWWFEPALRRTDGQQIPGTESQELCLGRTWQRWSRHFQPGQWHSGIDGLESFLALINRELLRCAIGSAA